jgi:hypothetical protein
VRERNSVEYFLRVSGREFAEPYLANAPAEMIVEQFLIEFPRGWLTLFANIRKEVAVIELRKSESSLGSSSGAIQRPKNLVSQRPHVGFAAVVIRNTRSNQWKEEKVKFKTLDFDGRFTGPDNPVAGLLRNFGKKEKTE